VEPKLQGQNKDPAPPPTIINEEEEYGRSMETQNTRTENSILDSLERLWR